MSHKANYWLASLDPNLVKSGAFRVLFHLCDHHNAETDPRAACFPSQETLRAKTGLSNGALNTALADMEDAGLIQRRRSTVPGSSERRTYYILGCDMAAFAKLTPENGVSPNSGAPETATEQTPVSEGANSSFGPSKLRCTGEEPVITMVGGGSASADATEREELIEAMGAQPMDARGRIFGNISDMAEVQRWTDLGLTHSQQIQIIRETMAGKTDGPPSTFKYFTLPMQRAAAELSRPALQPAERAAGTTGRSTPRVTFDLSKFKDIE